MRVDSFKFLPRLIGLFYQMSEWEMEGHIPWTPVSDPLVDCKFGLVTSGGLYHQGVDPPFDVEREREKPTWGDPSCRALPADIPQGEVGVSHLHYNPRDVLEEINILLPVDRFQELADGGQIGGVAETAYSFMGFQGYPPDAQSWRETYGPRVAEAFHKQGVDCVLLTTA